MPNNSSNSKKQTEQQPKMIQVGKFYFIHDQSKVGHPGYIVWKNDEKNIYLAIKFGSSPNEHNFPYVRAVGERIKKSYIYKRAFLGKRRAFSKKELTDMIITDEEAKLIKSQVDCHNPVYSQSINRQSKRDYKRLYKH